MPITWQFAHRYDQAAWAVWQHTAITVGGSATAIAIPETAGNGWPGSIPGALTFGQFAFYDDTAYTYFEPIFPVGASLTAPPSWTASEVALAGLSKNIALGGPGPGSFQEIRRPAIRNVGIALYTVLGTASPLAIAIAPPATAVCTATADPLCLIYGFTAGSFFIATANPQANFTGVEPFTSMGFVATASPTASTAAGSFTSAFLVTGDPLLSVFPIGGQLSSCVSGNPLNDGAPNLVY